MTALPETMPQELPEKIKVFVTYAWEDESHNDQVLSLTDHLRTKGFEAMNDKLLLQQGTSVDLQKMMYQNLTEADKVVIVLSKEYAKKADGFSGGVGIEYEYILKDIDVNPDKYILVSFLRYSETPFPIVLRKREIVPLINAVGLTYLYQKLVGAKLYKMSEVAASTPVFETKPIAAFEFKQRPAFDITDVDGSDDDEPNVWDIGSSEADFQKAVEDNNEEQVKLLIKQNSYLLYDIYERKMSAMPIFHDLKVGNFNIDFTWLDDASGGPIWFLLKVGRPAIKVFDQEGHVNIELLKAIEEVKAWENYFEINPTDKKRVFGAVGSFKFKLIAGSHEEWQSEAGQKWRHQHNRTSNIEIRSYNTFSRSINDIKTSPESFYRFNQFHSTSPAAELESFWSSYRYMDDWRKWL